MAQPCRFAAMSCYQILSSTVSAFGTKVFKLQVAVVDAHELHVGTDLFFCSGAAQAVPSTTSRFTSWVCLHPWARRKTKSVCSWRWSCTSRRRTGEVWYANTHPQEIASSALRILGFAVRFPAGWDRWLCGVGCCRTCASTVRSRLVAVHAARL